MKKWKVIGIGALLLLGAVLIMAMASPEGESEASGFRKWRNSPLGRMFLANRGRLMTLRAELNVTEEQRGEIRAIIQNHKGEFQPVAEKIALAKRALRKAVLEGKPVESDIRKASDELGKSIGEAAILASKIAEEIRPVLNEEQKKLIDKFMADKEESVDNWIDEMAE
ncbi:Spy/CpxP family protein refolding chaperone [Candidatus Sumerlaeota bacterium]|nr:Spy/CpxP family protein refolding chaperone [Candidatus Sumerlaeota bacterium]